MIAASVGKTGYSLAATGLDLVVLADPSAGAPVAPTSMSVPTFLSYLYVELFGQTETIGTEHRLYNYAGTEVWDYALTETSTVFTRAAASAP